jgi:hypothetical protein
MIFAEPWRARRAEDLATLRPNLRSKLTSALGPAIVWVIKNPPYFSPSLAIGLPAAVVGVMSLLKSSSSRPVELKWDREGIHYFNGDEVSTIPWTEYEGHRWTWKYIPPRLKIERRGQRPVVMDATMFDDGERQAFLDELGFHEAALPNMRCR